MRRILSWLVGLVTSRTFLVNEMNERVDDFATDAVEGVTGVVEDMREGAEGLMDRVVTEAAELATDATDILEWAADLVSPDSEPTQPGQGSAAK